MTLNRNQQEALNAAILAKMVGSELQKVDGLTVERGTNPANKININQFIEPIRSNSKPPNQANVGYIPESVVQQMVPEMPVKHAHPPTVGVVQPASPPSFTVSLPADQTINASITNEDIKSIRCHLERISGNLTKLTGMFGKIYCNFLEKEKK